MNQKQMAQAMKKLGMKQEEIPATEVIIRTADKEYVITEPNVSKVNMMGQDTYQITGSVHERAKTEVKLQIDSEDVKTVAEQAEVSEEVARKAIEDANGDLAEAILNLQS